MLSRKRFPERVQRSEMRKKPSCVREVEEKGTVRGSMWDRESERENECERGRERHKRRLGFPGLKLTGAEKGTMGV